MNYKLTKRIDEMFNGDHPNDINEDYTFEGHNISEITIGNCFYIFGDQGRHLRTSRVKATNVLNEFETEIQTENSLYILEKQKT